MSFRQACVILKDGIAMVASRRTKMTMRSLEEDKERFAEWRRQKHRGGRIRNELWEIASAHIPTLGLNRVAQEFRLDLSRLREKAEQFGVQAGSGTVERSARQSVD